MSEEPSAPHPVPAPPKHPLTQPIPVVGKDDGGPKRAKRRRRRRGRGRLPERAIVFVGPMAAGKTSLGRRVAKDLGVQFVDSDAVFQSRHGVITEFFERQGESEFRRIEAEIIAEQLAQPGVAAGLVEGARFEMRNRGPILTTRPYILRNTGHKKTRW